MHSVGVFYVFLALTMLSGLFVVTQSHPVRSVLFLVLTFFGSAVLWLMLEAEFLSLILLLVYVGAVMTLFLFVVMMLHVDAEAMRTHLFRLLPLGVVIVGGLSTLFSFALHHSPLIWAHHASGVAHSVIAGSNTEQIGVVLYTEYLYPFELAAVILLVAMVSAITLVHRQTRRSKRQDIRQQIMTQASERVRLHSIPLHQKEEIQ